MFRAIDETEDDGFFPSGETAALHARLVHGAAIVGHQQAIVIHVIHGDHAIVRHLLHQSRPAGHQLPRGGWQDYPSRPLLPIGRQGFLREAKPESRSRWRPSRGKENSK